MTQHSLFQHEHPLSTKKIWKKMVGQSLSILFMSVVIGGVVGTLIGMILLLSQGENQVMMFLWASLFFTIAFFIIFMGAYGLYTSAYIHRYYYDASEQFLTIKKGVFAPTEIHVPFSRIQDVYVDQDILDRIFGIYDVHIASATTTSGIEAHIDGVDAPVAEKIKNMLLHKIQYGSSNGPQAYPTATSHSTQASQAAVVPPAPGAFNSTTYPIQTNWIFVALLTNLWVTAFYTFMIWGFLLGKRSTIYLLSLPQIIVIYLIIYICLAIWSVLWKASFSFELLPQFVQVRDGVVRREEKHVPYRSLQNVLVKQGIIERLFGMSTVVIENAAMGGTTRSGRASRITIPGQPLAKGNELVAELNRVIGQGGTPTSFGL